MTQAAIAIIRQGDKFLAIKRSQTVRAPGKICFPGGGVEAGETFEQAVVRELREELGISIEPVRRIWNSVTAWDVEVCWILAEIIGDDEIQPDKEEVEWYRWMDCDELKQSDLLPSNADFLNALTDGQFRL